MVAAFVEVKPEHKTNNVIIMALPLIHQLKATSIRDNYLYITDGCINILNNKININAEAKS